MPRNRSSRRSRSTGANRADWSFVIMAPPRPVGVAPQRAPEKSDVKNCQSKSHLAQRLVPTVADLGVEWKGKSLARLNRELPALPSGQIKIPQQRPAHRFQALHRAFVGRVLGGVVERLVLEIDH